MCDPSELLASPLTTLRFDENNFDQALAMLDELAKEHQITLMALGYPKHMNNDIGESAKRSETFQQQLQAKGYDVVLIDERLTSKQVNDAMRFGKVKKEKRKAQVDELAATLILQTYLDQRRSR
jgi:putative Holliday junction resolvase